MEKNSMTLKFIALYKKKEEKPLIFIPNKVSNFNAI